MGFFIASQQEYKVFVFVNEAEFCEVAIIYSEKFFKRNGDST